ncbi:Trigger factor-like protein TIG, Chloroplastic [Glycine soja]|nr:Trigger factor-like protein TIG, Chloroplastic [Glycine max]
MILLLISFSLDAPQRSRVKDLSLQKCQEVEQTAREQVTDNAILDQISKTVQVDIPQSLFEEQGRQLYGANLLEIQVLVASCIIFRPIRQHKFQHAKMKLNQQQLVTLSTSKAVNEFLEHQKENITNLIKTECASW